MSASITPSGLQVPLRELVPVLTSAAAELAAARARLVHGETLDDAKLAGALDLLRPGFAHGVMGPRPLDRPLLSSGASQAVKQPLVDVLRLLWVHPKWRRVLGLGFFDATLPDPGPWQYRVSGTVPAHDLDDAIYGFATVPTGTVAPPRFFSARRAGRSRAEILAAERVCDAPPTPRLRSRREPGSHCYWIGGWQALVGGSQ